MALLFSVFFLIITVYNTFFSLFFQINLKNIFDNGIVKMKLFYSFTCEILLWIKLASHDYTVVF